MARPRSEGGKTAVTRAAAVELSSAAPQRPGWLGGDEPAAVHARCGEHGTGGEDEPSEHEEAHASVLVGEPPGWDEHDGHGQQVGRLDPHGRTEAEPQDGAHDRQGDGHDRRVQRRHERTDAGEGEYLPAALVKLLRVIREMGASWECSLPP